MYVTYINKCHGSFPKFVIVYHLDVDKIKTCLNGGTDNTVMFDHPTLVTNKELMYPGYLTNSDTWSRKCLPEHVHFGVYLVEIMVSGDYL